MPGEKEEQLLKALVSVNKTAVFDLLRKGFAAGGVSRVGELLMRALEEIGTAWENGRMSLAQVYMSGIISEEAVNRILPVNLLVDETLPKIGTAVFLDHHGLGMRIVSSLVRSAGYPLVDLGLGARAEDVIAFVGKEELKILLVSVLMYPSALATKELIREIAARYPDVKVVVGGAPFRLDETLWKQVGAHRMGKHAGEIFEILLRLQKELK